MYSWSCLIECCQSIVSLLHDLRAFKLSMKHITFSLYMEAHYCSFLACCICLRTILKKNLYKEIIRESTKKISHLYQTGINSVYTCINSNRIVAIMPHTFPYTFEYWLIPNCTPIVALGVVIIVLVFHILCAPTNSRWQSCWQGFSGLDSTQPVCSGNQRDFSLH